MTEARAARRIDTRPFIKEIKALNLEGAVALRDIGIISAETMGVSGFLTVYSVSGMELCSQAVGETATPTNVKIAKGKIKTVLATGRSSRLQRERMAEKGQSPDYFVGELGSLFGGGVAIFEDEELKKFIGAMAFSGGTEAQDEEIGRQAIMHAGFFTDVKPVTETAVN